MARVKQYNLKDGSVRWMVRFYDADGNETKKRGFRLKRDADAEKLKIEYALLVGEPLPQPKRRISVRQVMESFLDSKKVGDRRSTRKRDRSYADSLILPEFKGRSIRSLGRDDVQRWINRLQEEAYASSTIRKAVGLFSAACELAIDDGWLNRNPCRKVKLPRLVTPPQPSLSIDELYRLADQVPQQYRAMVLVGGLAGLRFGEVAALHRSDIDMKARTITIRHQLDRTGNFTATKTAGSATTLRVARAATEALERHIEEFAIESTSLLFTSPTGKRLHYSNWRRRVLAPAAAAIGRPDINGKTHVMRHTTGALVQREATTQVAQAAMRHKDYSTTFEEYGHMDTGITDLAAEAIDRQVAAAGAPTMRPRDAEVIELRPSGSRNTQ